MKTLFSSMLLFLAGGCQLLGQPAIINASLNGAASPPPSTTVYPNQVLSISGTFQDEGAGLSYAFFTFETWPSPNYSCKVGVQLASPLSVSNIFLHDDSGNPSRRMWLGSNDQDSNSKCSLLTNGSNVTLNGNQYTVTVSIVFRDPFNGVKYIYMDGYDNNGAPSSWYCPNAGFTVQSQDYAPQTLYVSPSSGSAQTGQVEQFTYSTSDVNGAFTMWHSELVFNQGSSWIPGYYPTARCKVIQDSNFVSLEMTRKTGT